MSVNDAVEQAARERPDLVAATAAGRPKAWGALAAHGVVTFRAFAGRPPTEPERRAIWTGLWAVTRRRVTAADEATAENVESGESVRDSKGPGDLEPPTLPPSAEGGRPAERYALMWSGGKDGALALLRARARGLAVTRLVNFYDGESGRVRFHATRAALIAAQASAIGIELRQIATSWPEYEPAFRTMLAELRRDGFAGVMFGDIHLADVRAWYEERVRAAGLTHIEPLWGEPPAALLAEFVASGSRAVITCTEDGKLDESWLGRIIDDDFVRDIAALPIDPAGENGEYHSFAFAGPLFRIPVPWQPGERRRDGRFSQLDLESSAGGDAAGPGAAGGFFVGTGADRTLVAGDHDAWPAGRDQIADSGIDWSF